MTINDICYTLLNTVRAIDYYYTFTDADLANKENERQMHYRNLTSTPATMEKSAVIKVHYPKDD